ncbi:hypothetical protein YPPY59_4749, partial [Yersinia pestis PY-59]|jgi:hypothetical protein
MMLA